MSYYQFYHVCLQSELSSTVLSKVELSKDLKGSLCDQWHYTWSGGGLGGPVTHRQHSQAQIHSFQVGLQYVGDSEQHDRISVIGTLTDAV